MLDHLARSCSSAVAPYSPPPCSSRYSAGWSAAVAGLLKSDDDFDPPRAEAVQARDAIAKATGASATPRPDRARAPARGGRLGRRPGEARPGRGGRARAGGGARGRLPAGRAARARRARRPLVLRRRQPA